MPSFLGPRMRIGLVAAGLALPVGGLAALASATPSASVAAKCAKGKHHFKTPHKDLDRDHCDKHGLDDGDGAKI